MARDDDVTSASTAGLCRLVLVLRGIASVLTLAVVVAVDVPVLVPFVLAGAVWNVVIFLYWERLARWLINHLFLMVDLALSIPVFAVLGPDNPFFYFTLGTAALAGVFYARPGAVLFSVLLLLAYWYAIDVRSGVDRITTFHARYALPVLYPLAAWGGAALRGLLVRTTRAERDRLARELHDGFSKDLNALAILAAGLKTKLERDLGAAGETIETAELLEAQALELARASRRLLDDVHDREDTRPLDDRLELVIREWSTRTGIPVDRELAAGEVDPRVANELTHLVREALLNVERHAHASRVTARLARDDRRRMTLVIRDDGVGIDGPHREGHYGIGSMAGRAEACGGTFSIRSGVDPDRPGTEVRAVIPTAPLKTQVDLRRSS